MILVFINVATDLTAGSICRKNGFKKSRMNKFGICSEG